MLIQGALWPSNTDLVIENPTVRSWEFRVADVPSPTSRSFKGVTISNVLARSGKQHIDLLKLDIEGSEEQLFSLEYSDEYSDWIGRVKNMMIEIPGQRCRDTVLAAVGNQDFTISESGEHEVFTRG